MIEKYALLKVITGIIRNEGEFSIHDTARNIKIAPSTAKTSLDFLLGQGVLEKRSLGKNSLFKVKDGALTRQIKMLYSIAELDVSGLAKELLSRHPEIVSIIVYGSVAKGEDTNKSDIDILIISRKKIEIKELKSEKMLKRQLSIICHTYNEWKEKSEKEKAFYYNVILNCVPLYGEKPVVA